MGQTLLEVILVYMIHSESLISAGLKRCSTLRETDELGSVRPHTGRGLVSTSKLRWVGVEAGRGSMRNSDRQRRF